MKNFIAISFLILFVSFSVNASNGLVDTDKSTLIIDNVEVSFTLTADSHLVVDTGYNEDDNFFKIETAKEINFLQVLNEAGELEYQLPIGAKVLKLSVPDFLKGTYEIKLFLEGLEKPVTSKLIKKN